MKKRNISVEKKKFMKKITEQNKKKNIHKKSQ